MIRLATVFSGIGAIEHALVRMNISHKIVFACDNGEVDILAKEVGMDIDAICDEISSLEEIIQELQIDDSVDDLYKQQLFGMLKEARAEYQYIYKVLSDLPDCEVSTKKVLESIVSMHFMVARGLKQNASC